MGAPGGSSVTLPEQGVAYAFRNLATASETVTEDVILTASGGQSAGFGSAVAVDGSMGVVGDFTAGSGESDASGAAYVFRNLDTAAGTITESATLLASDSHTGYFFSQAVSISGKVALIGAPGYSGPGTAYNLGAAYLFLGLDTVSGIATETVRSECRRATGGKG